METHRLTAYYKKETISPARAGPTGFQILGQWQTGLLAVALPTTIKLWMCTEYELAFAGSRQQLSKQPKAKNSTNFTLLSGESYNQHKQKKKPSKPTLSSAVPSGF